MSPPRHRGGAAIPAHVAPVAIMERDVLGAIAHTPVCQVPGCEWSGTPTDGTADKPRASVLRQAERHAARHTDAQDALDTQEQP